MYITIIILSSSEGENSIANFDGDDHGRLDPPLDGIYAIRATCENN